MVKHHSSEKEQARQRALRSRELNFLPSFEWEFHRVPAEEREACLFYECCREALRDEPGDEYRWRPWLSLSKAERKRHAKSRRGGSVTRSLRDMGYFTHSLHAFPYSVTEEWLTKGISRGQAKTLAVLEIDWAASDRKLKSDFADWLAERRAARGSLAFKHKGGKSKPGPKRTMNQDLVYLAIYRAKKAGYEAKKITKNLSPLIQELEPFFSTTVASQVVYDACVRAKTLIKSIPI